MKVLLPALGFVVFFMAALVTSMGGEDTLTVIFDLSWLVLCPAWLVWNLCRDSA